MLLLAVSCILLGYVVKACLRTHRGAQRDNGRLGTPTDALPQLLPGHPRRHQPIKGPAPQAQRSTGVQPKLRMERKGHTVLACSRTVPVESQPQRLGIKMSQHLDWRRLPPQSRGDIIGCRGKAFGDCIGLIVGCLAGNQSQEREGFWWIEEEQVWENRKIRG